MKKKSESSLPSSSTKIKFQTSDDEDNDSISSSSDEEEIENGLEDVTFEELLKARSDGTDIIAKKTNSKDKNKKGRANKNRPMEMSTKKPVSRFREVIQVPKQVVRDPRFESLCGNYDDEGFKKRYNFLYENDLPAEKEDLKKQLKKATDPEAISETKDRISWIDRQLKSAAPKLSENTILAEHKKKQREAAKQGKAPYYLKKSDIRTQKNIEKYNQLKASGKLESYIEKRRKRNAALDQKYMPYSRPGQQVKE